LSGTTTDATDVAVVDTTVADDVAAPTTTDSALTTGKTAADEAKADDSTTVKPGAPEKYDIKAPDGVELDQPAVDEFLVLAKAEGISNELAQKVIDFGVKRQMAIDAAAEKTMLDQVVAEEKAELDTLRKDPVLGGANFDATLEHAHLAFKKFATPDVVEFINTTRLGNRVPMIKMFNSIYHAFREEIASGAAPGGTAAPANNEGAVYREMYPSMFADTNKES
jgi:hypothetical protein